MFRFNLATNAVLIWQPRGASTAWTASSVPKTTRCVTPTTRRRRYCFIECVPPFTRGVLGHEIGLVLARELRPLVPGHPLPLSSPHRIQWHVCGGRRGQDGCDRADAV